MRAIVIGLMRRTFATASVVLLSACSETAVAPAPRTLTGNWGSKHFTTTAFALTETGGKVTGHGWFSSGAPFTVDGFIVGENVSLALKMITRNGITTTFNGVFANDALVGDAFGRVSLTRVDTVAEALGRVTFSNGLPPLVDDAGFVWNNTTLTIKPAAIRSSLEIFGTPEFFVGGILVPGTYAVGQTSAPFKATMDNYAATSGTLTIRLVGARALTGSFVMTMSNGTAPVDVSGTFSAACTVDYLDPDFPRCSPRAR